MTEMISARTLSVAACAVLTATAVGQAATPTPDAETNAIQWVERYCQASWRSAQISPQDWDDCTQQTFVELLGRVARNRWIEAVENAESRQRRELNRSIWCVTQRWRRRRRLLPTTGDAVDEAEQRRSAREAALRSVRDAIEGPASSLSQRQREILRLALAGASVAEIAQQLGERPQRISRQKYKALARLRASLA